MSYQSAIDQLSAMTPELFTQPGLPRRKFSLEEIGILKPSHIALQTQLGDFDQRTMLRQIELWGSKIIPAIRRELRVARPGDSEKAGEAALA